MQYKIPQNIGIEDKIVGPFSLRQLIILAIGGGISYVLLAIMSRIYELNFLEYIVIAIPAVLALLIAMVRIHNVTFGKYILLMIEFAIRPKKRMWDHRGIAFLVDPDLTDHSGGAKKEVKKDESENKQQVNLSNLSQVLDSGGFEHLEETKLEDIDEAEDDDLITEAYFGNKRDQSTTENMYWRTKDMQKKKLELLAKMSKAKATTSPAAQTITPQPETEVPTTNTPAQTIVEATQTTATPEPSLVPASTPTPTATEPTPSKPKEESVVANLAKVIQEAKENNQKKKRPRNKPKSPAQPVRENTQINTTDKNNPDKLIQNPPKEAETSLGDLKEGGEVEFNL